MKRILNLLVTASLFCGLASATIKPADVFSNHMVLQQGMPVPVWGSATPGETLTFHLAPQPGSPGSWQCKTTTTGGDGKWRVDLPAMKANAKGSDLTVKGSNEIKLKDVLVGEVWLCSGQSNMAGGVAGYAKNDHTLAKLGMQDTLTRLKAIHCH